MPRRRDGEQEKGRREGGYEKGRIVSKLRIKGQ